MSENEKKHIESTAYQPLDLHVLKTDLANRHVSESKNNEPQQYTDPDDLGEEDQNNGYADSDSLDKDYNYEKDSGQKENPHQDS